MIRISVQIIHPALNPIKIGKNMLIVPIPGGGLRDRRGCP
jgi:hypothetical protein